MSGGGSHDAGAPDLSDLATLDADIARVRAAIAKAEAMQEGQMGPRRVKRGDLATLYTRLDTLEQRRASLVGGSRLMRGTPR